MRYLNYHLPISLSNIIPDARTSELLRYHPRGPIATWLVADNQRMDSLSAHQVFDRPLPQIGT